LIPRNDLSAYSNPDNDPRGPWKADPVYANNPYDADYKIKKPSGEELSRPPGRYWRFSEKAWMQKVEENAVIWGKPGSYPMVKRYLSEVQDGLVPQTLFDRKFAGDNASANTELKELFAWESLFDYPKPVKLMKRLMQISTNKGSADIVLDFFAGSGTLAHAVMELNAEDGGNRKWICVQLPEFTDEKSEAYKAGYRTIAQISRERIRRAAKKIAEDHKDKLAERETPLDLGFRSYVLGDSSFKKWNELVSDPEEIRQQTLDHLDPIEPGAKDEDLLIEILLKRGISPLAKIEQHDGFVFVPDENLAISLARNMTEELFKSMLAKNPSQIIILDVAFNNDLNLKTNLVLQSEKQNTGLEIL
ncbi:site-specific DNA-methyltransferase, partial [Candidatus Saccharibacteria bacterium]|nr:site-specific DNA-methyltransferase [Candidatus Saccharibacteria bacterium]